MDLESPEWRFKMNHRKRKRFSPAKESPFRHLWPELAFMPPLNHWPDRPNTYTPERSEVLIWLAEGYRCDLIEADKIFQSARGKGVVRYNPETRLWFGTKGGKS